VLAYVLAVLTFGAVLAWVATSPRFRVFQLTKFFGMVEDEAREAVMQPAYLAALWAQRIWIFGTFLIITCFLYFGGTRETATTIFWLSLGVWALAWVPIYLWLSRRG
jgi:hypothetical protein